VNRSVSEEGFGRGRLVALSFEATAAAGQPVTRAVFVKKPVLATVAINAESKPHFYGMVGGLFPLTDNIDLKPSAIVKYAQNSPFSADANLTFVFNKKFNLGASYRTGYSTKGESIDGLMFFQINPKFGIGAAYDYNISDLRNYQNGSFEALIRYDFSAKDKDVITNPRFFF
jgi:type IX secretion system PorP/SprF family membrane protein